ncbi:hypothetical protein GF354_01790 [Candidatus Peregrinibacteria bacterium]|nr:hypothetical protein [Candidatus Peregrinibacteria bacterium]
MNIHKKFKQLGKERHRLTHQLLALLPEISAQKIWEREGYQSIFHYASVLAGLSPALVEKALKTAAKLEDKPKLKEAIKEAGIHKVALVANLATPENEEKLVDQVTHMSTRAIQQLSKEMRASDGNSLKSPKEKMSIELDGEMQYLFNKLKNKMGNRLSNKEILRRILKEVAGEENFFAEKAPEREFESRYVSKAKEREVEAKTKGRCSYNGCNKPIEEKHHEPAYAISHNHKGLKAMCKVHHEFRHNGIGTELSNIDIKIRKMRRRDNAHV